MNSITKLNFFSIYKKIPFDSSSFILLNIVYILSIVFDLYGSNSVVLDKLFFSLVLSFIASFFVNKLLLLYKFNFRIFLNYFVPVVIGILHFWITKDYYSSRFYINFVCLIFVFVLLINLFECFHLKNNLNFIYKKIFFFINIFLSFFISAAFFSGVSVVLYSVEKLFDFNFYNDQIFRFVFYTFLYFSFLIFIINPFSIKNKSQYLLKYFNFITVYLISPLLFIYATILYIYFFKIVKEWQLPNGEIAWMMIVLSVFSLFSLVLLKSVKIMDKYNYLKYYIRYFSFLILPLILLFLFSVCVRVKAYGVTESRYFLFLFAIWFFISFVYIGFIKKFKISVLVGFLLFLFFWALFSPWNAFKISKNSQQDRLQNMLFKNHISYKQNEMHIAYDVSLQDLIFVSSSFDYLIKYHSLESLNFIFGNAVLFDYLQQSKNNNFNIRLISEALMKKLNLKYIPEYLRYKNEANFYWSLKSDFSKQNIVGVKSFAPFEFYSNSKIIKFEQFELNFDEELFLLIIKNHNTILGQISLKEFTQKVTQYKIRDYKTLIPHDIMTIDFDKNKFRIKIWIQELTSLQKDKIFKDSVIKGVIFFY